MLLYSDDNLDIIIQPDATFTFVGNNMLQCDNITYLQKTRKMTRWKANKIFKKQMTKLLKEFIKTHEKE